MSYYKNFKIKLGDDLATQLRKIDPSYNSYRIYKKSLDARNKNNISFVYELETFTTKQEEIQSTKLKQFSSNNKTTIIGAGPAGIFAALRLVEQGLSCQILERGKRVQDRMKDIGKYWKQGILNEDSNVCFGQGGAGTFSDGKLTTRIKSEYTPWVIEQFIRFGAPEEIRYLSNPHVGSNLIRKIISRICVYLEEKNCNIFYERKVVDFVFNDDCLEYVVDQYGTRYKTSYFILATGHSAHDIYDKLLDKKVPCQAKSMAMGFRIEHQQSWLNKMQYGKCYQHQDLPVANYRLSYFFKQQNLSVYSFCMCPGGYVVPSSAQEGLMVVNGMSNYNHGSKFANSGLVVSLDKDKYYTTAKEALAFQQSIEQKAQEMVLKHNVVQKVPAQKVGDFFDRKTTGLIKSSSLSGVVNSPLHELYPDEIYQSLVKALHIFNRRMKGFATSKALLHGVESRTSSPICILRNKDDLQSIKYHNLYPAGEGAGFAGGITSAACDGIRIVDKICERVVL